MRKFILILVFSFFYSNFCVAEVIEAQCDNRDYDYMNVKIDFDKKILHLNAKLKDILFEKNKPSIVDIPIEYFDSERIEMKGDPGYTWSWYYGSDWRMVTHRETIPWVCKQSGVSQITKNNEIMFTIKDKREQCEAIGFKPETEKFADCVLRLVELDVKKQTQNQIVNAQNSGNEALIRQLERQNNIQSSKALIDLGQQLMTPKKYNSNIYSPNISRCNITGVGATAIFNCF